MNKKFSTLAAVFLAASALSTSAVAAGLSNGYYRLTNTAADKFLGVDIVKTDSIVFKAASSDDVLADRYFWKLTKTYTTSGDPQYVLANKKTGQTLAFPVPAKAEGATAKVVANGSINSWNWVADASTSTATALTSTLPNGKKYNLEINSNFFAGETKNDLVIIKEYGSTPASSLQLVPAANVSEKLSAEKLNEKNGTKGFELTFTPAANGEKNLFIESMLRAEAFDEIIAGSSYELDATDSDNSKDLLLAVNGKVIENGAKQKVQYYLVADTSYFTGLGNTGVVFTQDTLKLTYDTDGTIKNVEAAPGRTLDAYKFAVRYNYSVGAMNIMVKGIQKKISSGYYKDNVSVEKPASGKSWYVYVAELSDRKEVSVIEANTDLNSSVEADKKVEATKIIFKTGSAISDLNTKVAYAVQKVKEDGSLDKYYGAKGDFANEASLDVASALVPASQYILVHGGENNYVLYNRENGAQLKEASGAYYKTEKDGVYRINGEDYKLTALPAATGKYLGYRHFSDSEVANTSFTLRVQSIAGNSIFIASKDSSVFAAEGDGQFFKVKPYGDQEFGAMAVGDSLVRTAYMLIERYGKERLLAYQDDKFVLSKEAYGTLNDTTIVFFQATATEGQYHLALADKNITVGAYPNVTGFSNDGYIIANITTGAIEKATTATVAPTIFVFENEKNEYKTVAAAHKTISLTSDEAMAITRVDGNFANLKRVGQLRSTYEAENFSLWVDTASAKDETKPLYFITTNQGLDSTYVEAGNSLFMVSLEDSTTNAYQWEGLPRVAFVEGKYVKAQDSLELYRGHAAKDTTIYKKHDNEANWAFAVNPNGGVSLQNMKSGKYIATRNDVLVMVDGIDQAAMFNVEAATVIPTSNESINAEESAVNVIAGNGTVTVQGAAGQKVTIATVLGKVVASETLTSDNATITAPAGVVFVTVNGETTKVVVK